MTVINSTGEIDYKSCSNKAGIIDVYDSRSPAYRYCSINRSYKDNNCVPCNYMFKDMYSRSRK